MSSHHQQHIFSPLLPSYSMFGNLVDIDLVDTFDTDTLFDTPTEAGPDTLKFNSNQPFGYSEFNTTLVGPLSHAERPFFSESRISSDLSGIVNQMLALPIQKFLLVLNYLLQHENFHVRLAGIQALLYISSRNSRFGSASIPLFSETLSDNHSLVRSRALEAIVKLHKITVLHPIFNPEHFFLKQGSVSSHPNIQFVLPILTSFSDVNRYCRSTAHTVLSTLPVNSPAILGYIIFELFSRCVSNLSLKNLQDFFSTIIHTISNVPFRAYLLTTVLSFLSISENPQSQILVKFLSLFLLGTITSIEPKLVNLDSDLDSEYYTIIPYHLGPKGLFSTKSSHRSEEDEDEDFTSGFRFHNNNNNNMSKSEFNSKTRFYSVNESNPNLDFLD